MIQEFLTRSPLLIWPLVGLFIFLVGFVGVLLYVFVGLRDREKVRYLSRLPLADETTDSESASEGRAS